MFVLFHLSVAGVCAAAAVCRGHCGSDQTDVSHASDPSSETDFPGGLQILRCCAQVADYLNACTHTHTHAHEHARAGEAAATLQDSFKNVEFENYL